MTGIQREFILHEWTELAGDRHLSHYTWLDIDFIDSKQCSILFNTINAKLLEPVNGRTQITGKTRSK